MQGPVMRFTSRVLVVSTLMLGMPLPQANAGMIATSTLTAAQTQADRARVEAFMQREDVQQQMQAMGVDADQAKERIASLSDEEVSRIAGKLDQMPAGGDVLGVLFAVFIILLITDILGLTKIFPFTRSIR